MHERNDEISITATLVDIPQIPARPGLHEERARDFEARAAAGREPGSICMRDVTTFAPRLCCEVRPMAGGR